MIGFKAALGAFWYVERFYLIGPHCKNESQLSIIWQKVMAGQTVTKHCPGHIKNGKRFRWIVFFK